MAFSNVFLKHMYHMSVYKWPNLASILDVHSSHLWWAVASANVPGVSELPGKFRLIEWGGVRFQYKDMRMWWKFVDMACFWIYCLSWFMVPFASKMLSQVENPVQLAALLRSVQPLPLLGPCRVAGVSVSASSQVNNCPWSKSRSPMSSCGGCRVGESILNTKPSSNYDLMTDVIRFRTWDWLLRKGPPGDKALSCHTFLTISH